MMPQLKTHEHILNFNTCPQHHQYFSRAKDHNNTFQSPDGNRYVELFMIRVFCR